MNDVHSEDMIVCELLADLGDDLSWELVFELASRIDRKNLIGLKMTGTNYKGYWQTCRSRRNHLLKAMHHHSPKGEEA